jgi:hypothetical protein
VGEKGGSPSGFIEREEGRRRDAEGRGIGTGGSITRINDDRFFSWHQWRGMGEGR